MKMHTMSFFKSCIRISSLFIFTALLIFNSCESNDIKPDKIDIYPPDFSRESGLEYFYPDSGGLATQLVLKGFNLGSDTSYLKVTVNGKNAKIIGANNDFVYAIVPARADTGLVRLYLGKGDDVKEFVGDKEFLYQFRRNVSTLAGVYEKKYENEKQAVDGSYTTALFRRPWFITHDDEGVLYVIDEGRGTKLNGSLRRVFNGVVETITQNNTGPFQSPTSACFSKGQDTLFVANMSGSGVNTDANVIYSTRDGNFTQFKNLTVFSGAQTTSVVVNPVTGELFFNSQNDGYIYKYNPGMPDKREKLHQVNNANGTDLRMVFNPQGTELIICVRNRHCIYKANYNLATKTLDVPQYWVGQWGNSGYTEGQGMAAQFNTPGGSAFDEDGNLYVPERGNHIVRKITPNGQTSLWAGTAGKWGNIEGLPENAQLRDPECVTRLDNGELYVVEQNAHIVRRIVVE